MFQVGADEDSATDHRSPTTDRRSPIADHRFLSSVRDRPCSFASPAPGVTTLVTAPVTSVAGSGAVRGSAGSVTAKVEPDPTRLSTLSLIHISEPTRLGMISYAVFCLNNKK